MKKVVFICKGNIFRSQVAKAFYSQLIKDDSWAESYGTWVEEEGNQGLKLSLYPKLGILFAELKKYNIDISNECCEQLKEEYLKDADKIIVMAEKEFIPSWLDKYKYEYWENIPNPEVHTVEIIEDAVKLIREKVLKLI
jgi:protein-tyrosine-phosphatase